MHTQVRGLQALGDPLAQDAVEEAAAAEAHVAAAACAGGLRGPVGQRVGQREVKAGGGSVRAIGAGVEQRRHEAPQVEAVLCIDEHAGQRGGVGVLGEPARGGGFERDGGLGLVALAHAQAQRTGGRVEPAAGAAGGGAIQVACQHLLHTRGHSLTDLRREA